MKMNKVTDLYIAREVMGITNLNSMDDVLPYTSSIDAVYHVINRLHSMGWVCNVQSRITEDGTLKYLAKLKKVDKIVEVFDHTIPMAICNAAVAVIKNEVAVNLTKNDDSEINLAKMGNPTVIEIGDSCVEGIIKEALDKIVWPFEINTQDVAHNIISEIHKNNYIICNKKDF